MKLAAALLVSLSFLVLGVAACGDDKPASPPAKATAAAKATPAPAHSAKADAGAPKDEGNGW
ncbi:MAG TPA: hypothetical protein VGM56_24140 [Byssovorax sp.]